MAIRKPLRDRLTSAWTDVADTDYGKQRIKQRINSERSLQAALWARLNERLPDHQRMFIEPRFSIAFDDSRCIPDIVVCSKRRIIAVIEIKYQPRAQPSYRKDVRSLALLARHGDSLTLSNSRFSGPAVDGTVYTFSTNTLFVWAGFHRPSRLGTYAGLPHLSDGYDALSGRFMQLHAETSLDDRPTIFHRLS